MRKLFLIVAFILAGFAFFTQPVAGDEPSSDTIEVSVIDEGGKAAAGARVRIFEDTEEISAVTTDVAGLCRLPRPARFDRTSFRFIATEAAGARLGYLEANFLDPEEAGRRVRIVVKAPREITVSVTDKTGAP